MVLRAEVIGAIWENSGSCPMRFAEALQAHLQTNQADALASRVRHYETLAEGAPTTTVRDGWLAKATGVREAAAALNVPLP